jgi:hypothetical protein
MLNCIDAKLFARVDSMSPGYLRPRLSFRRPQVMSVVTQRKLYVVQLRLALENKGGQWLHLGT